MESQYCKICHHYEECDEHNCSCVRFSSDINIKSQKKRR